MIVAACVRLTECIGGLRAELELLPSLATSARHPGSERRQLVADAVAALLPLLGPQAMPALLDLLRVLLHDTLPQVRCTALGALAGVPEAVQGRTDCYSDAAHIVLLAAADGAPEVTNTLLEAVLPAVLAWDSSLMLTALLPRVGGMPAMTVQQASSSAVF